MDANEYQRQAMRSASAAPESAGNLVVAALGLCGESGEFADRVKKHIAQGHPLEQGKLAEELGDVCWYIAFACTALGLDLGEVMAGNIDKLLRRYPERFSTEASLKRADAGEG